MLNRVRNIVNAIKEFASLGGGLDFEDLRHKETSMCTQKSKCTHFVAERGDYLQSRRRIAILHRQRYEYATMKIRGKCLDVGCGLGYGCSIIKRKHQDIIGIDVSWRAILYAKSRYKGPEYVCCSACALPFRNESFDSVTSFEVIEHVSNQEGMIREILRVLTPHGTLLISTPNTRHLFNVLRHVLLRRGYPVKPENPYHTHEFYYEEFLNFLRLNGFHIRRKYGQIPILPDIVPLIGRNAKVAFMIASLLPALGDTIVVEAFKQRE
jgi:2-polyprenyl-3-methyl-5-hydroxy-6-metoxy-1,4-benzoquinol methylase